MKLHAPSVRLASMYLAVIMAISLFFSVVLYQQSMQELDRGLRRPGSMLHSPRANEIPTTLWLLLEDERQAAYDAAKARVINRLVLTNLLVLVGAGFLSYYLARRTLQPIEEANAALEQFTADASHELRTPLTAMQSEIEVALMDPKLTFARSKDILASNLEEIGKLTILSEGLLRLAKIESTGGAQKQSLMVAEIVGDAVRQLRTAADQKSITIRTHLKNGLKIKADEGALRELLVILLDNAVKYSPEKSEITIRTYAGRQGTELQVIDTGRGIKKADLPHIFDRFYQADTARSKQPGSGYGIGLAIAKRIVDAHNGTISVTSKPGKGSTFVVTLPN